MSSKSLLRTAAVPGNMFTDGDVAASREYTYRQVKGVEVSGWVKA